MTMYVPDVVPESDRQAMFDGNFGGGVEMGESVAVLVIDMTREFTEDRCPNGDSETGKPAVEAILRLMDRAREREIRGYYARSTTVGSPIEVDGGIVRGKPRRHPP